MRPAFSRVVTLWISVLCLLAALFSLDGLASAQAAAGSKHKLSKQALLSQHPLALVSSARKVKPNAPPPVTTDTWQGGASGNWSLATNWNNGAITTGENILINLTTAATTVDTGFSIGTLTLSKAGDSATIANGVDLVVGGNISNTGTITLDSTSAFTYLNIGANLTLSGTGTVAMGGTAPYNIIEATATGNTLTNTSTITGQGTIGNGTGLVVNNTTGTINANVSGANLVLNSAETSTNGGIMEATNGGNLILSGQYGGSWTNTGTISAATGSAVYLNNGVTVTGGTLSTTGTGWVYGDGATIVGLTNAGQFEVQNGYVTDISGTINNTGTITLASTSTFAQLQIAASGSASLSGGGTVVMGTGAQYGYIQAASGTASFTNSNNTIEGTGVIGNGSLSITNGGTINANVSPLVLNAPLEIDSDSGGITNTNLLEATNGGQLEIYNSTVTNSGTGAKIEANGADGSGNASSVLLNATTVNGGTLSTTGAGVIYGESGSELVGVTNTGNFQVLNGQANYISGTITNTGTITLGSTSTYAYLDLNGANATLTGGGTVVMGAGGQYSVIGSNIAGNTLTNSNNTIEGDGFIGNGQISFVNNATVNSNVSGQTLELQPVAGTNTSTMEATGGGTLLLNASTWTNTGGTITAATGSVVDLSSVTITGGTLTSSGTGVVYGYGGSTLVGLTNAGNFNVPNGNVTYLSGTITNTGTMTMGSTSTYTSLDTAANVTLTGGGTIVMGSGAQYSIMGGTAGTTLTNSNNTIEGGGFLGDGQITFVNNATVNSNVSGQTLEIQPVTTDINTKTMEATNGGTLELTVGSFTNTGGTITAATGSIVDLNSTTVTGGTLTTSGTGVVQGYGGSTLVGVTNAGTFQVPNGAVAYLSGTINNTGTMTLESSATYTSLDLAANTTLTGNGTIVMGAGAQYSRIDGASGLTFTNSGNTIEGLGNIGLGDLVVTNKTGSMIANVSGQSLTIQSSGVGTTNDGTFEAESGGILNVVGTLTNYTSGTNTLTSGTYIANGAGSTVYLPLGSSGGITTLSASVTEENGGVILNSNNANNNALNGLTSITSTGALTIGGVAFVDAGNFSNAGSLTILSGESFKVSTLSQISSGSLTAGTFVLDGNLSLTGATQTITTNATNLTLAGGTIENANSTNALASLATNTGKLTIGGSSNSVSTTAASFSNTGTLTINASDSFSAAKLTQISGTTLSGGIFVLGGNLDLTTAGISVTTNSSTLTLQGGTINSNGVNALAALAANTKSLTIAGSGDNVSTTAASFSNTGTLTINAGDSFTATTLTQLSGANNNKTLSGGTYVLAGNLDLTTSGLTITKNGATLTLEGGTINSNGVNALSALASNTKSLTIAGTSNNVSTSAASFSNTGTLTIDAGDTFSAPALTQISGTTLSGGTFVLAGNLDLTAAANITTNSSVLTLEGGTIQTGTTNDLANLSSNTDSLTLASNANFATVGSFTNSGALTINKGSKFTVSTGTLTNLSGGTLASGTYTIGGTLQLPTANGSITNNAANLTLTGTGFSIKDGTSNALSTFKNNTGTFALAGGAQFTTATTSSFTNSGTVNVEKGTKLTVGGSNHSYSQTAGTTTVDGTLTATSITATGGSIFGAGTLTGNTSVGNATGTAVTLNVGDSGKAGLLAITGTYTQLATGTMNVSIGGLTTGTYSALSVSGNTSLGGTVTVAIVNGLVLTSGNIGQTFTILTTTGTLTGSFSNGTVTSGTDVFTVSYTGNSVVLTLTSVTGPGSKSQSAPASPAIVATTKPASSKSKSPVVTSGVRVVGISKLAKPILVAGLEKPSGRSNAILAGGSGLRSWEHVPVIPVIAKPVAVSRVSTEVNASSLHNNLAATNGWAGQSHAIGTASTLGWMGTSNNRRVPVKVMPPSLPRMMR